MVSLRALGDATGVETPLLDGAWTANLEQNKLVVRRLRSLLPSLEGTRICVLGLTYKPDTSTLRRSAALDVIADLVAAGASVAGHDPGVAAAKVPSLAGFQFHHDAYEAAKSADAIVLMTPWAEYRTLAFARLRRVMRGNVIFDTAGLWQAAAVADAGFTYIDIGRGRTRPQAAPVQR